MNFASVLSGRAAGPILGLALLAVPAAAQQGPCAPYEIIAASLNERYHEAPVARMLADQGFVIEVLASADGATFTVLGVQPNGTACLLATGQGFAFVNAAATPVPGTGA
ncbi:MAG TPA: hypothetical protein VK597_04755 [Inquilinus sp.]|nr:hypothetical protein [Inquilinus sp.]